VNGLDKGARVHASEFGVKDSHFEAPQFEYLVGSPTFGVAFLTRLLVIHI